MSLPQLPLDTVTWDELRRLAQQRIPAASGGVWTHHAPVDPGITLLELFAYLLDQQVYVLDQVPDSLVRAVLRLLGEAARPTGIARTVLTASADVPVTLPAGSVVRPALERLSDLLFTVLSTSVVLPGSAVSIEANGRRSSVQGTTVPVPVLSSDGAAAAFDIVLELGAPAPAHAGTLGLLIELDVAERIEPSWAAEAVDVPPPAELAFAVVGAGSARVLAASALRDGTGGLRRSGLLSLSFPPEWSGAQTLRLRVSTQASTYAARPRIARITANAVVAEHAVERVLEGRAPDGGRWDGARQALADQLDHWLPLSHQELDLPAALGTPIEGSVELALARAGSLQPWTGVEDLSFAAPNERQFALDRARARLTFGDGYRGRVPAPATDFSLRLRAGGGAAGNLPAGVSWVLDEPGPELRSLSNVVAADGGCDAESIQAARQRVAGSLSRSERVVTDTDIRELVENLPGLGPHRAHVVVGFHPAFPCVYVPDSVGVFVVPRVPRRSEAERAETPAPQADPGALQRMTTRLEASRMLATRLHVLRPRYRPVSLAVTVRAAGDPGEVRSAIQQALAAHLDAAIGGGGEGWTFGHPLRPSELIGVAQKAAGDEAVVERVAIGIDDAQAMDDCNDTPIGRHELVYMARAAVQFLTSGGPR